MLLGATCDQRLQPIEPDDYREAKHKSSTNSASKSFSKPATLVTCKRLKRRMEFGSWMVGFPRKRKAISGLQRMFPTIGPRPNEACCLLIFPALIFLDDGELGREETNGDAEDRAVPAP
jgi:hypothetical protein